MTTNPEEAAEQYSEVNQLLSEYQQEIARQQAQLDGVRDWAVDKAAVVARAEAAEQRAGALEGALREIHQTAARSIDCGCCIHILGVIAMTRAAPTRSA